jgi:hypothetical protein
MNTFALKGVSFNTLRMQIRWFIRNSVCKRFIGYKTMREFWTAKFSVMRARFMSAVRSMPTISTCLPGTCSWQPKGECVLRPQQRVYGPFFMENHYRYRVSGHAPTVPHSTATRDGQEGRIQFQQGGAPLHCLGEVREYLSTHFPGRWIGRAATSFPGSYTPAFFLWGFVTDRVFVATLPAANVVELRTRVTAAVAEVTSEMLRSVWQEADCRWDVCRIASGRHTEP